MTLPEVAEGHRTGRGLRKLILGLLVSLALLFALTRFANLSQTAQRFDDFYWGYLPPVLASVLAYYLLKGLRWHIFLRLVGVTLPLRVSLLVYLAGQWFAFSPAGEFVKAYLLRRYGVDFARASATVVMQVVVDFLSLAVLASLTLFRYPTLSYMVLPFTALLFLVVGLLGQGRLWAKLGRWRSSSRFQRRLPSSLSALIHDTRLLAEGKPLLAGLALGLPTTLLGSVTLLLVAMGYAAPVDLAQATFVYSLSYLLGALSMLPHGLGATEGSALALFAHVGLDDAALAAVVIALFRLATLVWGVGMGGLALLAFPFLPARPAYSAVEPGG